MLRRDDKAPPATAPGTQSWPGKREKERLDRKNTNTATAVDTVIQRDSCEHC